MADVVEIMARSHFAPHEDMERVHRFHQDLWDQAVKESEKRIKALHDAGLVIVPRRPSIEAIVAGRDAMVACTGPYVADEIRDIYRAMLEASQK